MNGAEPNRGAGDSLVALLADRRRRLACAHVITAAEDVFALEDLAEGLAMWETESTDGPVSDERLQRIAVALHHCHLPKLAEAGIVEYDARSRTVRYRGSTIGDDVDDIVERTIDVDASQLPTRDC